MKDIYMITAMDEARGIGKNNQLPWKLSADLKYFQKVTTLSCGCCKEKRNAVIMGRKTFESIGNRPLKNRLNIVLTSQPYLSMYENLCTCTSLINAIEVCERDPSVKHIYVIGGEKVYEMALKEFPLTAIYITQVQGTYDCDRFFPSLEGYQKDEETEWYNENGILFSHQSWIKSTCE